MALVAPTTPDGLADAPLVSRPFAWVIFGLIFGLLLSDYMSRQVLNAVSRCSRPSGAFRTRSSACSRNRALMVGLLTIPLSFLADRFGRITSLKVMAFMWSLATLACGFAEGYSHMFIARFLVGVGEAAYGSVGIAVILSVFPAHLRATLAGSFLAGGIFGSVLGMGLGGAVAAHFGWRWSFFAMAGFGFAMLVIFALVVTDKRVEPERRAGARAGAATASMFSFRTLLPGLFSARSVIFAYVGNGLQLFIVGAMIAWLPSYFNRIYAMPTEKASAAAAVFVLISGIGMVACGAVTDRLCRSNPVRKFNIAVMFCVSTFVLLGLDSAGARQRNWCSSGCASSSPAAPRGPPPPWSRT